MSVDCLACIANAEAPDELQYTGNAHALHVPSTGPTHALVRSALMGPGYGWRKCELTYHERWRRWVNDDER